ncbi:MAG: hypothetical protein ACPGSB_01415 [Opitutales bacterium]
MTTIQSYKSDKYYPGIVRVFDEILQERLVVEPVEVFIRLGNLDRKKYEDWRFCRVPYLERVIEGNLSKCSRILKILRFHAHDLSMSQSFTDYRKWGKGENVRLRFTKSGIPKLERDYATCFKWNRKVSYQEWKNQNQAQN